MKKTISSLFLFASILFASAQSHAILNGSTSALDKQIKDVVVLITQNPSPSVSDCSGTRIAKRWVLTAGHCAEVSGYVHFSDGITAKVLRAIPHPRWDDDTDEYDVSLLYLEDTKSMGPVALLASSTETPSKGSSVVTTGFGYTGVGEDAHLHFTQLTVTGHLRKTQLVLRGNNTGICSGDSGGGHFQKKNNFYHLALVSSSTEDEDQFGCDDKVYAIPVSLVRGWIDQVISQAALSTP